MDADTPAGAVAAAATPTQQVAGVADGGVGEHPLEVGLDHGQGRPDQHSDHGHGGDDRPPGRRPGRPAPRRTPAGRRRTPATLVAAAMKAATGVRRALVDVGRPHVERHRRHLEQEPDRQQPDPGQQQGAVAGRVGAGAWRSPSRLVRAGGPVATGRCRTAGRPRRTPPAGSTSWPPPGRPGGQVWPASTYRLSDRISRAMNTTSRSEAAASSTMPSRANSSSRNTSGGLSSGLLLAGVALDHHQGGQRRRQPAGSPWRSG